MSDIDAKVRECMDVAHRYGDARSDALSAHQVATLHSALYNTIRRHLEEMAAKVDQHERVVAAIIKWLEANQPDVFKRGIWDAIDAAKGKEAK